MDGKRRTYVLCALTLLFALAICDSEDDKYKPKRMRRPKDSGEWKSKDVLDYNEGDVEKLFDQWEEDEEELPVDELPPWEKEPPPIDMRKVNIKDKDSILREGKRHRTLMMFATIAGKPNRRETEQISGRWETSLYNANVQIQRYVLEEGRILFQMDDGSKAIQIRDFLLTQDDCYDVTVDSKTYDGPAKLALEKNKPMTKEQAKVARQKEAEEKAEKDRKREQYKKEKAERQAAEKAKKDKKQKAKGKKTRKEEL